MELVERIKEYVISGYSMTYAVKKCGHNINAVKTRKILMENDEFFSFYVSYMLCQGQASAKLKVQALRRFGEERVEKMILDSRAGYNKKPFPRIGCMDSRMRLSEKTAPQN